MSCPQDCLGRVSVSSEYPGLEQSVVGLWVLGVGMGGRERNLRECNENSDLPGGTLDCLLPFPSGEETEAKQIGS